MSDPSHLEQTFPVPVARPAIVPLFQLFLDKLGLPRDDAPTIEEQPGDAKKMSRVTKTWQRGDAWLSVSDAMDHEHPPMESADRRAWVSAGGLPGGMSLFTDAEGNASRFESFRLIGEEPGRMRILEALATSIDEYLGDHVVLWSRLLVPPSWETRVAGISVGSFVVRGYRRALAPWVDEIRDDGIRVATEIGGGLELQRNGVWRSPVGPIPKTDEANYFTLSRIGRAGEPPPLPDLPSLAKALLDVTLAGPEAVALCYPYQPSGGEKRRFRAGSWILLDAIEPVPSDTDKRRLTLRIQNEHGDPWCLLLTGEYRGSGWAELRATIIGDAAARASFEARLGTWAAALGFTHERRW